MTGYFLFWILSAVALAAFMGYWAWRIEHGHRRRMQGIAEAEAADQEWQARAAKVRAEHLTQEPPIAAEPSLVGPAGR